MAVDDCGADDYVSALPEREAASAVGDVPEDGAVAVDLSVSD
jgi:hypothetical protein